MYLQLIPDGMMGAGLALLIIAVAGRSRIEEVRAERAHQQRSTYEPSPELVADAELWEEPAPTDLNLN